MASSTMAICRSDSRADRFRMPSAMARSSSARSRQCSTVAELRQDGAAKRGDRAVMDGAALPQEARAEADRAKFSDTKRQLLDIAEQYDRLARQADDNAANRPARP